MKDVIKNMRDLSVSVVKLIRKLEKPNVEQVIIVNHTDLYKLQSILDNLILLFSDLSSNNSSSIESLLLKHELIERVREYIVEIEALINDVELLDPISNNEGVDEFEHKLHMPKCLDYFKSIENRLTKLKAR